MNHLINDDYVFNIKLSKYIGLYQILDPSTVKFYNCNVFRIFIIFASVFILSISLLCPMGFYHLMNDVIAFTFYLGVVEQFLISVYKALHIVYYSSDLWKIILNTSYALFSYAFYNRNIFKYWQKHSLNVIVLYIMAICFNLVIWTITPFIFNNTLISVKNLDNSYSYYRLNILNVYLPIPAELYNIYFNVFYIMDSTILVSYLICTTIHDIFKIMTCYTLVCQLETVNDGFQTLGENNRMYSDKNFGKYPFTFLSSSKIHVITIFNHTFITPRRIVGTYIRISDHLKYYVYYHRRPTGEKG